jgi:hypothetical protein
MNARLPSAGLLLAVTLDLAGCAHSGKPAAPTARPVAAAAPASADAQARLLGRWEGVDDEGKKGAFEFRADGTAIMEMGGERMGDPADGGPRGLRFSVDAGHAPAWLDLIAVDRASGRELSRMLWVIAFPDDHTVRIRTFFNDQRPLDFTGATPKDTLLLMRTAPPAAK